MTRSLLPIFLIASLTAHSVVFLQPIHLLAPAGSSTGATTLQISIVKPTPKQPIQKTIKKKLVSAPTKSRSTSNHIIKPTASRVAKTAIPANAIVSTPPRQLVTVQQFDKQTFDAKLVRGKLGHTLQEQLKAKFVYPQLARKRGWQGNVLLSLRIEQNGQLSNIKVSETSGYRLLDNSALNSANTIKTLPEAVKLLQGNSLTLTIPVYYQLLDS
jgi:protein TonB